MAFRNFIFSELPKNTGCMGMHPKEEREIICSTIHTFSNLFLENQSLVNNPLFFGSVGHRGR
jgi:hypothetical protein